MCEGVLSCFYFLKENRKLRDELSELRSWNSQLEKKIDEINRLQEEVRILATINEALGNESDKLRKKLTGYEKYQLPKLSQDTNFGLSTGEESSKRVKSKSDFGLTSENFFRFRPAAICKNCRLPLFSSNFNKNLQSSADLIRYIF